MRVKTKNPLGMSASEASGAIEEAPPSSAAPQAAVLPYRLVPALGSTANVPAVLVSANAQMQAGSAEQHAQQLQQPGQLSRQQSGAAQAASENRDQPSATSTGRPVRKRKGTGFADDMIPVDAVLGRSSKVPRAGSAPAASQPPAASQQQQPLATAASRQAAAHSAAAPAALPAAIQLVSLPAPGGGTVTGLAVPAAALLAMPALLQQHQQQLLRAQGGVAAALAPTVQLAQPAVAAVMPYRLVRVGDRGSTAHNSTSTNSTPPAVQVAGPRDIVHLAKQLEEEERKKALAASDARVVLRVLPGAQVADRGTKPGSSVKPPTGGRGGGKGQGADGGSAGRGRGSRGGSGRFSRRATPEVAEERLNLPPGTWHPGFEAAGGITYINVLQSSAAPPLPAVAVGTPPRLSQPAAQDPQAELAFSEDPLRATLEFLRNSAKTAGRQPHYTGTIQAAVNAEQRLYMERLARAHFARDGRRFARESVQGTRKSVRMRTATGVFSPDAAATAAAAAAAPEPPQQRARPKQRQARPEDATDVRRGAEFQAKLPSVRPRPAAPSEKEAHWTAGLVCQPGDVEPPQYDAQRLAAMPAASAQERAACMAEAHDQLCALLGEERAAAMGLLSMGAASFADLLTAEEEAALEAGMRELGRAFHAIQLEHVPTRTVFDLQNYYYNVWKLRSTERSRAWYEEKAAEEAQRQAEQERLEQAAAAEQEANRQRQEQRYKRRMLREVVQWIKTAARAPLEVPNRPTVIQRAQRAAKLIGSLNAKGAEEAAQQ